MLLSLITRNDFIAEFLVSDSQVLVDKPKMEAEKEKPKFCCSFCDFTTNKRQHLAYHERSHTGERPYKCSYCEKTYVEPFQLKVSGLYILLQGNFFFFNSVHLLIL